MLDDLSLDVVAIEYTGQDTYIILIQLRSPIKTAIRISVFRLAVSMKTPFLTASYKDDRAAAWLERRSRMKEYHLYEVFEYFKRTS